MGIFCFKEIKEQGPFFQVVVYVLVEKTEGNKLTLEWRESLVLAGREMS